MKVENKLTPNVMAMAGFLVGDTKSTIRMVNLLKFRKKNKTFKFNALIKEAYLNRVSLSSSGFYATPKIHFDKKNLQENNLIKPVYSS